jgi:hypothetical protein
MDCFKSAPHWLPTHFAGWPVEIYGVLCYTEDYNRKSLNQKISKIFKNYVRNCGLSAFT